MSTTVSRAGDAPMEAGVFARAAQLSPALAMRWYGPVMAAMHEFGITSAARQAMFIAQVGHESLGFTRLTESFDYSIAGLAVFGARLSLAERAKLGRQAGEERVPPARQQLIANRAYGGRFGNGDAASGDGWRYRGRGLKQITFADNYRDCARALGLDLLTHPELLEEDGPAARSAGWFWAAHALNACADRGNFAATTRIINGLALEGQAQRVARWKIAQLAIGATGQA
ncbi:glycoside hydrolase family 19 protein [Paraburkholderia aspalathi]|uniref:glycoside hydrolase family 19 protein n=1 Tax=Paraburkholderia aspalathi TaxID=1324617 RepID=UPI0038B7CB65